MSPSGCTGLAEVALFVDVEPVLSCGKTVDGTCDFDAVGGAGKGDPAVDGVGF